MPITKSISSRANLKQTTNADFPLIPAQLVTNMYGPVASTASQTVINLGFAVPTTNTANFFLVIDGKILAIGASNDFTFTNIQSNGTSSQVTLNISLPAGLNIQAWYLGVAQPPAAATSISTINAEIAALQPAYSLKTTSYTLAYTDVIVQFNCASGNLIATLPDATAATKGQRYEICRAADATIANSLTVNTTSSQTINGRASGSIVLSPNDYLVVVSDGSNWKIAEIQETIVCSYYQSTTSIPSATDTAIAYSTKIRDTHSAYSSTTFTAPSAGTYLVNAQVSLVISSAAILSKKIIVYHNGSPVQYAEDDRGGGTSAQIPYPINTLIICSAGDTIQIHVTQGTSGTISPVNDYSTFLNVSKTGN